MNGKKANLNKAPGTVVFTGQRKVENVQIVHLQYDETEWKQTDRSEYDFESVFDASGSMVDWYDVRGLHDTELIESFGRQFNVHPLALEDIADTQQRPKFDDFPSAIFLSMRALSFDNNTMELNYEHITLCAGAGYVISFQEDESDLFASVRKRITSRESRIRKRREDYLLYALADAITDNYYHVMEQVEDIIEKIEDRIVEDPKESSKSEIYHLKRQLQTARKTFVPLREAIGKFSRSDNNLIEERTYPFVQDLYDHTIQLGELLDSHRDFLYNLQDLYNSEVSFKMNQVMQVLTVVSTIFIPLTFLCGVYGMNFINIPELTNPNGYFYLWGVMLLLTVGCLLFFRKKGWI
ncbi:magnesium and cobalt transport protein CorA [Lewinellaceae bacterium SD302]|nr:magnesium and cobalt transport protein CorA [Lewinellaceae bacterium SD302]